ncbi:HlyD family secretion protein [Metapseudomonas otitidis]|uniref:HlyD family secretion protein n=1 Tax=Metapseudomonas otitidis TaxID=319939 RepID=UPI00209B3D2C|nr:HlyD family efflux transporter periplasmic adaptor subunit [Pseudomonas otitidis]MCO7557970.1 HlyD family efflux transporter periplasmic adaptor subunit [Pseudomonas otitidis]
MNTRPLLLLGLALLAACKPAPPQLLGTLEWDRIAVPAEASEPILDWHVAEGEQVSAGQVLLELDPRRTDARLAEAEGDLAAARARLDELRNGSRDETIDAARASLARYQAELTDAERSFTRIAALYERRQVAIADLDRARAARDQARASVNSANAQLRELLNGTRPEQLHQAEAQVQAAEGRVAQLRITRERLTLRAPRDARVDALPYKPGDQPPAGAELASLLVGEAPYARVYVPASQRPRLAIGDHLQVQVQGIATPFDAQVRRIASEAAFTPYYALTGDDASRLAYRAELLLQGDDARRLPAGLPLQAHWSAP